MGAKERSIFNSVIKDGGQTIASRIPVLNSFVKSPEEEALERKQAEMREAYRKRYAEQQQAGMNSLAQRIMAFAPQNKMMAQVFGPDAAFSPQQMSAMGANPNQPQLDPSLVDYRGLDPNKQKEVEDYFRQKKQYEEQEAKRKAMIEGAFAPLPKGPAPIQPTAVAAARRY